MADRSSEPKRTVILVADLDGPEIAHLRSEAKRRYDVGFVLRKSADKVKTSDLQMSGALVRIAYFSDNSLRYLNSDCANYGPFFAFAFDYQYSSEKADLCTNLPYIRYRNYTRNLEGLISVFGEIAADIKDMSKADAGQLITSPHFRHLGHRIRNAALAISALRLNTTSDVVSELNDIADDLLASEGEGTSKKFDVRHEAKKTLTVLSSLFDHIENSGMARIIVSGAVTAVIADVGWSAVACQTVQLASWHGKDAFLAAVKMLPSFAGSRSKKVNHIIRSIEVDS